MKFKCLTFIIDLITWDFSCFVSTKDLEKALPQKRHLKGFSPVWFRMWSLLRYTDEDINLCKSFLPERVLPIKGLEAVVALVDAISMCPEAQFYCLVNGQMVPTSCDATKQSLL